MANLRKIIINSKVARKPPCLEIMWCLQINFWNAKDILSSDELLFFPIIYFFKKRKRKCTCILLSASGNSHSFIVYVFSGAPWLLTLLECLARGTEKQCTMVKSNYRSSFTLIRLFAQSLNSSDAKKLSRGCKKRQLQMRSSQNHFYMLWSILMEGFSFYCSLLLGTQSLQSGQGSMLQYVAKKPIVRIMDNCIAFFKNVP